VPFVEINNNGNESTTHQWTVLQPSSVLFSTNDADNDTVTMYAWIPLPPGSSLSRTLDPDIWEFSWTPQDMNPVELV